MKLGERVGAIEDLAFEKISIGYEGVTLIDKATVDFPAHRVLRLRSASGAGKSSVLKVLVGLLEPLDGEFVMNGLVVSKMSFEEFLPFRLSIGFSFDHGGLLNNRSVRDNLALPLQYHKLFAPEEIDRVVNHYMQVFQLTAVADRRPSAVSGSQRKATCVARALVNNPRMVVLDDPSTGLGEVALNGLNEILRERVENGTLQYLIISSDDERVAAGLPSQDLFIEDKKLRLGVMQKTRVA